jgi:hypothetical protein
MNKSSHEKTVKNNGKIFLMHVDKDYNNLVVKEKSELNLRGKI